ncbi:MAG: type II toxin-antitoxin system VapC family toxin [Acidimicrobiales bacterium]
MALVLDTGAVIAALNQDDPDHQRCADLLETANDLILPSPVLVEIDYWLIKLAGPQAWVDFIDDVASGAYHLVHPVEVDLARAAELELTYADLRLGFVDAAVIALCERLGETKVATLDLRHFGVVRPRHCRQLSLLPP